MVPFFAVTQVLISSALVVLVLMHSGREAGFGGMGFTPQSQGGTHIVERNLTRLTAIVAVLFFVEHRGAVPGARVVRIQSRRALVAELVDAQG